MDNHLDSCTGGNNGIPVKIGVFFCTCGHMMNDYFDVKALMDYAAQVPGVAFVDENRFLCTRSGLEWLRSKIVRSGCNRFVIAGCSPHQYEVRFMNVLEEAGLNRSFLTIANIREGCAWACADKEGCMPKARQILSSAIKRVALAKPLEKVRRKVESSALVIGAGISGIQMAIELHGLGLRPILVEKQEKVCPKDASFMNPCTQGAQGSDEVFSSGWITQKLKELDDKKIEILTSSQVTQVKGGPGAFRVTLETAGQEKILDIGSIVVSTEPEKRAVQKMTALRPSHRIVSLSGLSDLVTRERRALEQILVTADKRTKYVCFILGEAEGFAKRSTVMALNEAIALKKQFKAEVVIAARDIIVSGTQIETLYQKARQAGILFFRSTEDSGPTVSIEKGVITVRIHDPALDRPSAKAASGNAGVCGSQESEGAARPVIIHADLLVFEDEILPGEDTECLKNALRVNLNKGGFYQEANIHLKPNLSNKKGIFLAGSCHGKEETCEALGDVRSVAMAVYSTLSRGYLETEQKVVIDTDKCALCLTCFRSCPHQAIEIGEVELGQKWGAKVIPEACQGCGICAGECPAKAIEMVHYSDNQIFSELTLER
ncbi:MAG: 4Fe-4S binding protein [bacterium]